MSSAKMGQVLSATTTLGSYDFLGQWIQLNTVEKPDFGALDPATEEGRRILSLVSHETTHWVDHLSTLWGADFLVRTFEAFEARVSNKPEQFWRLADVGRILRAIRYPKYYTTELATDPLAIAQRPWKAVPTVGRGFTTDGELSKQYPIVFYRFANRDGVPMCRVPFSISSLLELNATAAEHALNEGHLASVTDVVSRKIEHDLVQRRILDLLHTPELGEYSVAAHWAANRIGHADVSATFRVASALATLSLNLPCDVLAQFAEPSVMRAAPEAHQSLVSRGDRGYAFFCLVEAASTLISKSLAEPSREWLQRVLNASGPKMPSLEDVEAAISAERAALSGRSRSLNVFGSRLQRLLTTGDALFAERRSTGIGGPLAVLSTDAVLKNAPPLLLGDGAIVSLGRPIFDAAEVEEWFAMHTELERHLHDFLDACFTPPEAT